MFCSYFGWSKVAENIPLLTMSYFAEAQASTPFSQKVSRTGCLPRKIRWARAVPSKAMVMGSSSHTKHEYLVVTDQWKKILDIIYRSDLCLLCLVELFDWLSIRLNWYVDELDPLNNSWISYRWHGDIPCLSLSCWLVSLVWGYPQATKTSEIQAAAGSDSRAWSNQPYIGEIFGWWSHLVSG